MFSVQRSSKQEIEENRLLMAAHVVEEVCPLRIAQQNLAKGRANTVAFGVYGEQNRVDILLMQEPYT